VTPLLFADSNVFIEALFIPGSAASIVTEMVAREVFNLTTCHLCIEDVEKAIITKLQRNPAALDTAIT
jgi:hypothetical protein